MRVRAQIVRLLVVSLALVLVGTSAGAQESSNTAEPAVMDEEGPAPRDIVHQDDDVIVEGSLCAGDSDACNNGEDFVKSFISLNNLPVAIKVKGDRPVLYLEDWNFGEADWFLLVDQFGAVPNQGFGIGNDETNTFPFVIEHGAANNVLYLDAAERVGINTASPSVELHVQSGSPEIRLDDVGEGQVDLGVSQDTFFFEGNTGQNIIQIDTTANAAALGIGNSGWVGFGTFDPGTEVEIASGNPELRLDDTTFGEGRVDLDMSGNAFDIQGNSGQNIVSIDTRAPFTLDVDLDGEVGIGTSSPGADLHIRADDPTIRLEDESSMDRWELVMVDAGNRLEFTDINVARTPFKINSAPTDTLVVGSGGTGRVGVGTAFPAHELHVRGTMVSDRVGAGTLNPTAALDVSGVLKVRQGTRADDFKVRRWASGMADVDGLLRGSRIGVLIEGSRNGHTVVGLRENGFGDTFSIIGGGGNWNSDATYDTLLLSLDGRGNLEIDGALTENSDVASKARFSALDPAVVLAGVVSLNVAEWEYRDTPGVRHVGPTAQDFHEAFGLGAAPTGISTLDTSGVALVSIQALADLVDQQAALLQLQSELIADLQAQMAELQAGIKA